MDISGNVALVTGGGSGLGAATVRHLAGLGAKVAVLDYNAEAAEAVAAEVGGAACPADVSNEAAVQAAVEKAAADLGEAPRIAINCAGLGLAARIVGREGKLSTDLFEKVMKVNLFGTYYVMSHTARLMQDLPAVHEDGERGVIVNTASAAYQDGQLGQAAYAASKGGVASMCLPAAREFAKTGIRVNAIAPGLFNTPMMESLPEETTQAIIANVPYPHRLGLPREYAMLVQHMIENAYLNGEVIRLDGATRLPPR